METGWTGAPGLDVALHAERILILGVAHALILHLPMGVLIVLETQMNRSLAPYQCVQVKLKDSYHMICFISA